MSDTYISPEDWAEFEQAMKAEEAERQARQAALTPAAYDRWDTIPGAMKITSKNTPEQQQLIDQLNHEYAVKWITDHKKKKAQEAAAHDGSKGK